MKTILAAAVLVSLLAVAGASAAPHHPHRVCTIRHHHRVCHMVR